MEAFRSLNPTLVFIFDKCDKEWDVMVEEVVNSNYTIKRIDSNQNDSYLYQLDLAKDVNDYVLFQEDDYVYLPGAGEKVLEAIKVLEFVNPYDHLEFYTRNKEFHKPPFDIKLVGDQHWRTIDFNTMTWGTHSERLNKYWKELHMHGFWDKDTWFEMNKSGAKLWSPIPGLATHMHKDFLSPGVKWDDVFNRFESTSK